MSTKEYFRTPNWHADSLAALLTPGESVALAQVVRHTVGRQKQSARISIPALARWTGQSEAVCRQQLRVLLHYGVLLEVAPASPKTSEGAEFKVPLDESSVRMAELRERRNAKKASDKGRMAELTRCREGRASVHLSSDDEISPTGPSNG